MSLTHADAKTYQMIVASTGGDDIWHRFLAFLNESHELEDDSRVVGHLVNQP